MSFDWREDLDMDSPEFNLADMVEELTYNWHGTYHINTFTAEQLFNEHTTPGDLKAWVPLFRDYGYNFDLPTIKKGLEILRRSGDLDLDGDVYTSNETGFWGELGAHTDSRTLTPGLIGITDIEIDEADEDQIKFLSSLSRVDPTIIERAKKVGITIPPPLPAGEDTGHSRDLQDTKEHEAGGYFGN